MSELEVNALDVATGQTMTLGKPGGIVELAQGVTAVGFSDDGMTSDVALLAFKVAANGSLTQYELANQTIDNFQDDSGIDVAASSNLAHFSENNETYWSSTDITKETFLSTGLDQSWTVPAAVTEATFKCWGSSSGASGTGSGADHPGGFSYGKMAVTENSVYRIIVGDTTGYGGGYNTFGWFSGGLSGVFAGSGAWSPTSSVDQGLAVIIAGGAGAETCCSRTGANGESTQGPKTGGSGGGLVGGSGQGAGGYVYGGSGGSQSAIGAPGGGSGGNTPGYASVMLGGPAHGFFYPTPRPAYGGSGGGGYWGGGGGSQYSNQAAAGGGGSGFVSASMYEAETLSNQGFDDVDIPPGDIGRYYASGAVVVKYLVYSDFVTLVSNATTAVETPTTGDIVMTYSDGAGTAILNTDLTAEISSDNGVTWTLLTLVFEGTSGGHNIVAAHRVSLISTGTEMRYRIKTVNQSITKETRIQAVSLGWS